MDHVIEALCADGDPAVVEAAVRLLCGPIAPLSEMECERLYQYALARHIESVSMAQTWHDFVRNFPSNHPTGTVLPARRLAGLLLLVGADPVDPLAAARGGLFRALRPCNEWWRACVVTFRRTETVCMPPSLILRVVPSVTVCVCVWVGGTIRRGVRSRPRGALRTRVRRNVPIPRHGVHGVFR